MLTRAFQHRSGRVISLSRLAVALAFLLAIWLDPTQPSRLVAEAYAILLAYIVAAALYLAATWNDWWRESRLALPAHLADIAMFTVMVFLTEGYTSPFFTFFVFVLLSAIIKWGWRETAATAAAVTVLFFAAGLAAMVWAAGELEVQRLVFRGAYLIVLSIVLVWFSYNQRGRVPVRPSGLELDPADPGSPPATRACRYAGDRLDAERVLFCWWEEEEPWVRIDECGPAGEREERTGPELAESLVAPELGVTPFLFDLARNRTVRPGERGLDRIVPKGPAIDPRFAERLGDGRGIAIPVRSDLHRGWLFALGIPGLCTDDLAVAADIAANVSAALEHATLVGLIEENAATRTRLSFTRDLHDSIVQLLVGTSFRLEGMREAIKAGRDVGAEIEELKRELAAEQRDLRGFIRELRETGPAGTDDLRGTLATLAGRLGRQWGVACELLRCPSDLRPGEGVVHHVCHLVREAVANAVRHGGADRVTISAVAGGNGLSLRIADNGSGFAAGADGAPVPPWSLAERTGQLGGSVAVESDAGGSRLILDIPLEARP